MRGSSGLRRGGRESASSVSTGSISTRGSVGTRRYWTVNASSSSMTAGEGRVVGGARMMHSVRCSCGCAVGGVRWRRQPTLLALLLLLRPAPVHASCDGRMNAVATPPNAVATIAGSSTATQAASQPIGSTLVFTCSAGYSANVTYTCDQNGQFTTSDSACAAPPGPPSTSSNCTATGMTVTVPSLAVILTTADVLSLSAEATSTQPCTVGQRSHVLFRWTLAIGTSNGGLPSNFTVTSADL
eukprot:COSAG01_NODE_14718_length_1418_cov_7.413950_1_plen_241_part_10